MCTCLSQNLWNKILEWCKFEWVSLNICFKSYFCWEIFFVLWNILAPIFIVFNCFITLNPIFKNFNMEKTGINTNIKISLQCFFTNFFGLFIFLYLRIRSSQQSKNWPYQKLKKFFKLIRNGQNWIFQSKWMIFKCQQPNKK